jgi:tetraacyldisaccharide 4'-kinase
VGLLCRGYRGQATVWPQQVTPHSDPFEVGDEAVLLRQKTDSPVMAGADRVQAGRALLHQSPCDVILCDDGLQHYALKRDLEIIVIDPEHAFGNGACLPAGPLREPRARLRQVDVVVSLGDSSPEATETMRVTAGACWKLDDPDQRCELATFAGRSVHAVAGIAHPQRFFQQMRDAGLSIEQHEFDDHHCYLPEELVFDDQRPVLMTEKDAVKCRAFARPDWWVVPLEVQLDEAFGNWIKNAVRKRSTWFGQKTT